MRSVAIYRVEGGVGKSTVAIHLAWCAAAISQRRTLLWNLDRQDSASFLLRGRPDERQRAQSVFARSIDPKAPIIPMSSQIEQAAARREPLGQSPAEHAGCRGLCDPVARR